MLTKHQFKILRALKDKKGRDQQGRFLIEGIHLCRDALASGAELELLLYTASGFQNPEVKDVVVAAQKRGISNLRVSPPDLKDLGDTVTPQGIMAVVKGRPHPWDPVRAEVLLLLDQVRDPGNVGTIIRTADAVGVDAVFLSPESADILNPKALRSTQGSFFHLPVHINVDPEDLVNDLTSRGFDIIVAEPRARKLYTQVHFPRRFLLVVGNETRGVRETLTGRADQRVRVPIRGHAESLNVAMATGVILYEALRQRTGGKRPRDLKKWRRR